jgi:hypothetical protein
MKITYAPLLLGLVLGGGSGGIQAAEHPTEHPEAKKEDKGAAVTKDKLAEAIESYVESDAALKGGYFLVYDPVDEKVLQLTLDKVHDDRLAQVSENVYFVCADFKTPEGKKYDMDIFMEGKDVDHLRATDVSIHKVEGKARYGWKEEKGIWKKVKP